MGCDIHWILERRGGGRWFGVESKSHWYSDDTLWKNFDETMKKPQYKLGGRNYDLFTSLSNVRGSGKAIATDGIPSDASKATLQEKAAWRSDGHSWGFLSGRKILSKLKNPTVGYWAEAALELLRSGEARTPLPDMAFDGDGEQIWSESQHEKLESLALGRELDDFEADPDSWRIVVFYDN